MRTELPLSNGWYVSESLPISAQECVNWYPNRPQTQAASQMTLFGTPGLYQVATTGSEGFDANRGAWKMNGTAYFVNRTSLYRLNSDWSLDNLGEIEGSGRVSMADNGTEMVVLVPGGKGYVFTEDPDTLTEITDSDFRANGNPLAVVFIDGYFVFTTDANKFILSAIRDGLSYNALDVGTAESSPDGVVIPFVFNNQLFIVGVRTQEAFNNIGSAADFPFQRSGLFLDEGTIAPFSVVKDADSFVFMGQGENEEPAIYKFVGESTEKISTTAIDSILEKLTDEQLADVWAWSYAQAGHYFVGFNLPNSTLVYDSIEGLWHERRSEFIGESGRREDIRFRANSVISAYGKVLVGDSQDGRIGVLDLETYTEYGNQIRRVATTQPFYNNQAPFFTPYLELVLEAGVGNDDVEDPKIRMERSLNGGRTWSYSRDRAIGKKGEYTRRVVWRRLGRTKQYDVFRFILTDAVKPVLIGLFADLDAADEAA